MVNYLHSPKTPRRLRLLRDWPHPSSGNANPLAWYLHSPEQVQIHWNELPWSIISTRRKRPRRLRPAAVATAARLRRLIAAFAIPPRHCRPAAAIGTARCPHRSDSPFATATPL